MQQEGVSAGGGPARRGELGRGLGVEALADHGGHGLIAERAGTDYVGVGVGVELGEQLAVGARLVGAQRQHQQHGEALEPRRQVDEKAQAGGVGPVSVVHLEDERPPRRQVRDEPVEAVGHGEGGVAARRALAASLQAQHGSSERRRVSEHFRPLGLAELHGRPLEQLADDPVREVALELASAGPEGLQPALTRALAGGLQQQALADSGAPPHHHEGALLGRGALYGEGQALELGLALDGGVRSLHRPENTRKAGGEPRRLS